MKSAFVRPALTVVANQDMSVTTNSTQLHFLQFELPTIYTFYIFHQTCNYKLEIYDLSFTY